MASFLFFIGLTIAAFTVVHVSLLLVHMADVVTGGPLLKLWIVRIKQTAVDIAGCTWQVLVVLWFILLFFCHCNVF